MPLHTHTQLQLATQGRGVASAPRVGARATERVVGRRVGHDDVDEEKEAEVELGRQGEDAVRELGRPVEARVEALEDDLHEGKLREDQERAIDERVDPVGDVAVGDLVDVALGVLELHDEDEPDRGHGEPAEDVGHHAPDPVARALRAHEPVDALDADLLHWVLDVVEGAVARPLGLRDELERVGVVVVVRLAVLVVGGVGELLELQRAHGVLVVLLVHVRLGRADVLGEEAVGLGGPGEHEERRERVLLADAEHDAQRHGHERGRDGVLGPAPPQEGVVHLAPVPEPPALEGARDARKKVEDGGGGKEGDDERRQVDRHAVVVQEEAVVGLGGGKVPALGPARDVVVEHVLRRDVADAVDRDEHVLGVLHGVEVVAPVGKVVGDEDHDGVRDEAHEVEDPDPLRRGEARAAAEEELAVALLARDARDGHAVLVGAEERHRGEVVARGGHGLARLHPVGGVARLAHAPVVARRNPHAARAILGLGRVLLAVVRLDKVAPVERVGPVEELARGGHGRRVQQRGRRHVDRRRRHRQRCGRLAADLLLCSNFSLLGHLAVALGAVLQVRLPPIHVEQLQILEPARHAAPRAPTHRHARAFLPKGGAPASYQSAK
ncbi:MAG: hypothetical protein CL844_03505 [Crocinitomicaceae bacterium]|nr:hypothetical protein [Crocinitomicaceae bacterium]